MPRLNGLEVWEVLRRDCPETPVIILTGQGEVGPLLPAAGERPYGYLEKPVEVPQLRMLVAKALAPETTREPHAPSRAADLEDVLASCQVPSGPAVPLPQGANRWRSSPEGGLR